MRESRAHELATPHLRFNSAVSVWSGSVPFSSVLGESPCTVLTRLRSGKKKPDAKKNTDALALWVSTSVIFRRWLRGSDVRRCRRRGSWGCASSQVSFFLRRPPSSLPSLTSPSAHCLSLACSRLPCATTSRPIFRWNISRQCSTVLSRLRSGFGLCRLVL